MGVSTNKLGKKPTPRERSQPERRKKFGFLEKHKDYVIRAKRHHKRKDFLNMLKQKAALKNPDEFYFKMVNSKLTNGVHMIERVDKLTKEKLFKLSKRDTQYLLTLNHMEKCKVERLRAQLAFSHQRASHSQHIVFVSDDKEQESMEERLKKDRAAALAYKPDDTPVGMLYRKLQRREKRCNQLRAMFEKLMQKKHENSGEDFKYVTDPNTGKKIVKFKMERKK